MWKRRELEKSLRPYAKDICLDRFHVLPDIKGVKCSYWKQNGRHFPISSGQSKLRVQTQFLIAKFWLTRYQKFHDLLCTMILILDGNSEICAHVKSNLFHLICSRHSIWSRVVTNQKFSSPKWPIFIHTCA